MLRLVARDLAVDLGTANTLIYEVGGELVLSEPSCVAVRVSPSQRRQVIAYGAEAKAMLGRVPEGVQVIKPVRNGVIADFDMAAEMLRFFFKQVRKRSRTVLKPRVMVGIPGGVSEVEKRAIREALEGEARDVKLIDEAMAAAIGCDLPVAEATASLIVDIGGGTTDIAVISLLDVVYSATLRQGGDAMDEAIVNYVRRRHHLLIGESTAEHVKRVIGSAHPRFDLYQMEIKGRSLTSGAPESVVVGSAEIREAISEIISAIIGAVRHALEKTPPELSGDIVSRGILLSGGGSLLRGIDLALAESLNVMVKVADNPLSVVAYGAGRCLGDLQNYRSVIL
ncbi:MAG TPA: rod shape-determining protein [Oligoflexia bacterium]|nr:rod shape-determining protein [Oligoflexia bacterium]HMP27083.1 rod shape-determining protein [Oligoflexia bacterium]